MARRVITKGLQLGLFSEAPAAPSLGLLQPSSLFAAVLATNSFISSSSAGFGGASRHFSSKQQWAEFLTLPSRKGIFSDAATVATLLPHRKNLAAQFSPHGITLVPRTIFEKPAGATAQPTQAQANASPGKPARQTNGLSAASTAGEGLLAHDKTSGDRTKMWRRLKIKKHKIRKRRKLQKKRMND